MDDYTTAEIMAAAAAAAPDGASPAATPTPSPSHKPGLMGTLREKAGFQDRLVERSVVSPSRAHTLVPPPLSRGPCAGGRR